MTAKLAFDRVTKRFGEHLVADDISIDIDNGEFFVILGPSGEGKSTLLRMVAGIESVDAGSIRIDGTDVTYLPPNRRNVAMVFQNYALYPNMNVYRNIAFPLRMQYFPREEIEPKVRDVARTLGITEILDRRPNQISGGQQQRVAIARALALEPKVLLFDEPTSALDPELVGEVLDVIKELARSGATLIIVTHEIGFAREVADTIVFMEKGRILEVGTPEKVFNVPDHPRTAEFLAKVL